MKTEQIMDHLVQNRAKQLPPEALAEVFDRLIWCTVDNGSEILEVRESWLEGDDYYKCHIALLMNETFPYECNEKMIKVLGMVSEKWPELNSPCKTLIQERLKQKV